MAVIITLPPSASGSSATIENQPVRGATGQQQIKIRWTCPPYGEVRYRIRAYATSTASTTDTVAPDTGPEYEELYVVDHQSVERLVSLMTSKEHIRLVFTGPDVARLAQTGLFGQGQFPPQSMSMALTGAETVAVILIISTAGVATFVIAALTAILMTGMALGYRIEVEEVQLPSVNPPNFGRLQLKLIPPGSD